MFFFKKPMKITLLTLQKNPNSPHHNICILELRERINYLAEKKEMVFFLQYLIKHQRLALVSSIHKHFLGKK